ncbi:MAG: hypothetical protein AAF399_16570 [Bacteroidota bacterium]
MKSQCWLILGSCLLLACQLSRPTGTYVCQPSTDRTGYINEQVVFVILKQKESQW